MKWSARYILAFFSLIMLSAVMQLADAQQGVVAYWSFDSMVGDTFKDISGNGYNAIVSGTGVGLASGVNGNAVECPIGGGYDIAVTNSANSFVMNHFSIEAWVSMDTVIINGQQHLLNFENDLGDRNGYALSLDNGSPDMSVSSFDGTEWINDNAGPILQANTWYHLVGTFDSLSLRIYINGVLQATNGANGGIRPPGTNANIGCKKSSNGVETYYFGGRIDELKVYNFTLPADSILAHYQRYAPPPGLVSPVNNAVNQSLTPTLTWSSINGDSYTLQVSTNSAFLTTVISQTGITAPSLTIAGLEDSTGYFWRVNATSTAGNSNWSGIWNFTTVPQLPGVPVLASPLDSTLNQPLSLYLIWSVANHAASYSLQVSTSSIFSSTVSNQSGLTSNIASIIGLSNNAIYYWRVNAANPGGTSLWSGIWRFSTVFVPPNTPVLLSPASGTIGQPNSLNVYWSAANLASLYSLQVSTSSTFLSTIINQSGLTGESATINGLANDAEFYWRVNASNSGGISGWSSAWSFIVGLTSVSPIKKDNFEPTFSFKNGLIAYSLNRQSPIGIRIYNILGRKIFELNKLQSSGSYSFSIRSLNLSSELYIIHFKAGTLERQMTVLGK
jgi:hypothetical protein